jgi:hypothetical protein
LLPAPHRRVRWHCPAGGGIGPRWGLSRSGRLRRRNHWPSCDTISLGTAKHRQPSFDTVVFDPATGIALHTFQTATDLRHLLEVATFERRPLLPVGIGIGLPTQTQTTQPAEVKHPSIARAKADNRRQLPMGFDAAARVVIRNGASQQFFGGQIVAMRCKCAREHKCKSQKQIAILAHRQPR